MREAIGQSSMSYRCRFGSGPHGTEQKNPAPGSPRAGELGKKRQTEPQPARLLNDRRPDRRQCFSRNGSTIASYRAYSMVRVSRVQNSLRAARVKSTPLPKGIPTCHGSCTTPNQHPPSNEHLLCLPGMPQCSLRVDLQPVPQAQTHLLWTLAIQPAHVRQAGTWRGAIARMLPWS